MPRGRGGPGCVSEQGCLSLPLREQTLDKESCGRWSLETPVGVWGRETRQELQGLHLNRSPLWMAGAQSHGASGEMLGTQLKPLAQDRAVWASQPAPSVSGGGLLLGRGC